MLSRTKGIIVFLSIVEMQLLLETGGPIAEGFLIVHV